MARLWAACFVSLSLQIATTIIHMQYYTRHILLGVWPSQALEQDMVWSLICLPSNWTPVSRQRFVPSYAQRMSSKDVI